MMSRNIQRIDKAEVSRKIPARHCSDANRIDFAGTEENRGDAENTTAAATPPPPPNNDGTTVASASNDGAKPEQLCLLDSNGNKVIISSMEQFEAAIALLERSDHDPTHANGVDWMLDKRRNENEANNFSTRTNASQQQQQQAFLDEVKRFELFRSVIQHEDDLLNQRVSWIILAQSFLMAAFITNTSEDGTGDALKYITATVGLLTVVVTMPAILAAGRNIELQQKVYFARIGSEERCHELHGHGRNILRSTGERDRDINLKEEQRIRLEHGHIFPNMAFRGRGSVPILFTVVALAVVQVVGWCCLLVALVKGW